VVVFERQSLNCRFPSDEYQVHHMQFTSASDIGPFNRYECD